MRALAAGTTALVISTSFLTTPAHAGRMPLDAQNRLHAGVSLTDTTLGAGGVFGMDSRLTRLVFVDIGVFYTPGNESYDPNIDARNDDPRDWYTLRHGIYAAPGLRIPHRYSDGINWDVVGRAGFAAVWVSDVSQSLIPADKAFVYSEPSLLVGADALIRWDHVGLRVSGKAYGWTTVSPVARTEVNVVRPQFTVEGVYQF